ncbi:TPA: DUF2391 family protein [archaeon]|uniref:DUF2391 family protein n=1 Tax=Candidatus Naiadarchaeum limnaeum TaxID=2756139 RepID=A0A832XGG5_9ARCH|nr:DUF2391 family protein [Candidatus Naiadarchaeales archaeon SRR2090153.bin1042]HIK00159.1 DUF2391 family protein [Candidatus Naiadarchaeum limnaeum]
MAKKGKTEKELEEIKKLEQEQLKELKRVKGEEKHVETELGKFEKEIESLKKEIKPEVTEKFTYKDIARGIVGAIFGMSIMGWHEGVRNAAINMPSINVALIVLLTIIAGASVLYFSQYRRIKEKWIIHQLLPKRFLIFYILSLLIVFFIYTLFNIIQLGVTPSKEIIRLVLVIGLPAVIGASAADIIR